MKSILIFRSCYYGDISPKRQSSFYVSLVHDCISYYHDTVVQSDHCTPHPLVVNTCGWVTGIITTCSCLLSHLFVCCGTLEPDSNNPLIILYNIQLSLCCISPADIGYPLFLDVVRTVKPTHIIQLRNSNYTQLGEVPLLSRDILNCAPGWSLKAKDPSPPQQLIKDVALFSEMISGGTKKDTHSGSPIMILSEGEDEEIREDRVISLLSSESEREEEMEDGE